MLIWFGRVFSNRVDDKMINSWNVCLKKRIRLRKGATALKYHFASRLLIHIAAPRLDRCVASGSVILPALEPEVSPRAFTATATCGAYHEKEILYHTDERIGLTTDWRDTSWRCFWFGSGAGLAAAVRCVIG